TTAVEPRTAGCPAPRASISADIARKAISGASPRIVRPAGIAQTSTPESTRTRSKEDNSSKHAPHTEHRYQRISPESQEAGPHRGKLPPGNSPFPGLECDLQTYELTTRRRTVRAS
ncbi:unnamed protein product, partial [Ectocarpus sp. 13 AM-2016]